MDNIGKGKNSKGHADPPGNLWRGGLVAQLKSYFEKRRANKKQEKPSDKAARVTANATHAMAWLTFVLAVAGILNIRLLQKQLAVAKDTFNAANRPYVGLSGVEVVYLPRDFMGNPAQVSHFATPESVGFDFRLDIKNFGTVPATNVTDQWRVFVDGIRVPVRKQPDAPSTVFPGEVFSLNGNSGEQDYRAFQDGRKILSFEYSVDYSGPSGPSHYCEKHQYSPEDSEFINLGACRNPN